MEPAGHFLRSQQNTQLIRQCKLLRWAFRFSQTSQTDSSHSFSSVENNLCKKNVVKKHLILFRDLFSRSDCENVKKQERRKQMTIHAACGWFHPGTVAEVFNRCTLEQISVSYRPVVTSHCTPP